MPVDKKAMRCRAMTILLVVVALTVGVASPARTEVAYNTGLDGSACKSLLWGEGSYPGLEAGVSTTSLGPDAPAYYEVGSPSGAFLGQPPKGIMIVIHGGGWFRVGKNIVAAVRSRANRWRAAGWATVNIDYRACRTSAGDVLWFMNRIRARNPRRVICASGDSAGAQLALLLASIRDDLACVMAYSAPSDLVAIREQVAFDRTTGLLQNVGPRYVSNLSIAAFGSSPRALAARNPIGLAAHVRARVLLAASATDPLIPAEQNVAYAAAVKAGHPSGYVDSAVLAAGTIPFVHSGVSQAALDDLRQREDALVAPLVG
jgi:acetyl esterase/lipase